MYMYVHARTCNTVFIGTFMGNSINVISSQANTCTCTHTVALNITAAHHITFLNGEMNDVRQTMPPSAKSLATSEIRRMFSSRSSGVKPRFLFRP